MAWLDGLARRFGYVPAQGGARRSYEPFRAGTPHRLTADWITSPLTGDAALRRNFRALRERCRILKVNDPHARRFFGQLRTNVIGPEGIRLRMDIKTEDGRSDLDANRKVMDAWSRWQERGICTTCGTLDWVQAQCLALDHAACDGDLLVRKAAFDNDFGFALQLIEGDLLDHEVSRNSGENVIRLGVEFDAWDRPIAYWLHPWHPGDELVALGRGPRHVVRPAVDMLHLYVRERITQSRGYPWLVAAMLNLRHLGAAEEAAIIAMRIGAAKMGFIQNNDPDAYGEGGSERDGDGNVVQDVSPGSIEQLPPGAEFKEFNPGYPTGDYAPFRKAALRGVAAGLGVSYNSLTWDLEGVNFSSLRHGTLEERDAWKMIQRWFATDFNDQVFKAWLPMALLTRQVDLPARMTPRILQGRRWKARGWPWIDPMKDQQANRQGLENLTRTRRDIAEETGEDWEEQLAQLAEERRRAEELGLPLTAPASAAPPGAPGAGAAGSGEDDDED